MTKAEKATMEAARENLREYVKPGDTIQVLLRNVARSGMSRSISPYVTINGELRDITYTVGKALGYKEDKWGGLRVSGCGMDMGFALVHELSHVLYPAGFECVGEHCPSEEHANGDRNREPHHHGSGGYALRHRWI